MDEEVSVGHGGRPWEDDDGGDGDSVFGCESGVSCKVLAESAVFYDG